jgi:hypothetical protein
MDDCICPTCGQWIPEEGTETGAPIITDMSAFDQKTEAIRAAGFTKEADSRDKYAHPRRTA